MTNDCKIVKRKINQIRTILDKHPERKEKKLVYFFTKP